MVDEIVEEMVEEVEEELLQAVVRHQGLKKLVFTKSHLLTLNP